MFDSLWVLIGAMILAMSDVVNFQDKYSKFTEQWSPKIIAQMNDYHFKLAKVEGDFTWHDHKDTDEVFIIIEGSLRIDYRDKQVHLNEGELHVVPKGVEHKPFAERVQDSPC